ncbi:outer membrane protein transport protein [Acinetobacter towneri]|uniref:outer membrane protein transport protein n=1 Tax=Acinetobacter towneri TaxID=202956 RepID=UPI001436BDB9|nr:outer membrane protein transport protein [Acinetobacter towneri]MCA4813598.1 outer membrane protein transport protein [Acinetobacter towneri]QIV92074.1 outer membrane transporter family protein [Acinetobacter towneri]
MKFHIFVGLLCVLPLGYASAAALERSGQSVHALFEKGNYAEVALLHVDTNISGQVQHQQNIAELGVQDFSTGNLVNSQHFIQAALKLQPHPQVSVALLFDQPFFTDVDYQFDTNQPLSEIADVEFDSNNMTALVGYQPNANWNLFTGVSYQSFSGNLRIGTHVENFYVDYAVHFPKDHAWGWLVGASYQLSEYAFNTAITYRSKIKHHTNASESFWGFPLEIAPQHTTTIQTPESINLDFQTGLPAQNFLYASLRWVNWQDFEIQPIQYAAMLQQVPNMNLNLIDYQKNQWSTRLGVAHQWSSKWITAVEGLWDSGAGNPASSLNPVDGYVGVGTGAVYHFNPKTFMIAGLHYLYFTKPEKTQPQSLITQISSFSSLEQRDAWVYHLKLAHRF